MQVLKFGGSSVANPENIKRVVDIIKYKSQDENTIVVVSALGGITNQLLEAGRTAAGGNEQYRQIIQSITTRHLELVKSLLPLTCQSSTLSLVMQRCHDIEDICHGIYLLREFSSKTEDRLMAYGELLSSWILSAYLTATGTNNIWKDARELIKTDVHFTKAVVDYNSTNHLLQEFFSTTSANLFILPGFIASDPNGNTTTLGRGGSDYTAAIIGASVNASSVEIWTDVSGMMTADPRLVTNARQIPTLSYQEAMELSHFGAKVVYPPTIQPVMNKKIPVTIKNTFAPEDPGTLILANTRVNGSPIRGISSIKNIALLSLEGSGMVGIPGFSKRLFEALAHQEINVVLITQASSEHSICVGVEEKAADAAKAAVDKAFSFEIETGLIEPLIIEKDLAIVALVGDNMKNQAGTSGKMFGAIGRNGINIRAIAQGSSERNISAVIAAADVKKAINVLHEEFFESTHKQINLFIAGAGNVGTKLLAQLQQQQPYLLNQLNLQVRIVGLSNSRLMVFNDKGIDLSKWREELAGGEAMQTDAFLHSIENRNLRNSVFVDVTANEQIATQYKRLLDKSISVVACNKIACSSPYHYYHQLKEAANKHNTTLLFETNVGAGLPIIGTLNDLLRSGDEITRIEAVLSGTLNYVFNNYNGEKPFAEVVRKAQEEGYTEPDPRLDLSGKDVMRKILILAREAGEKLEMEEIKNQSFMPESCMKGSVEDFYQEMLVQEPHFKQLYTTAAKEGKKLKFVAKYENGKASVGLQHIDPAHDFYHLYGKDNIILFYTHRYVDQPMVVKGAGAGAEVTASGVFADIIRASRI
jgi:bifunctional aspartokinase / homoserine dehydrogenase 1